MASVGKREWRTPKGEKKSAWEVRWKDGASYPSKGGFALKKDALAFKRKVENEIENGTKISQSQVRTVAQICEAFLRHQEHRVKDGRIGRSRYEKLKNGVDKNVVPFLGAKSLEHVRSQDVTDMYEWMGRTCGLAPKTAKDRLQMLGQIMDFAIKRGSLRTSPVTEAMKELRGVRGGRIQTFTIDDVRKIVAAVEQRPKGQNPRAFLFVKCAIHLALCCGLRRGEILGLTLESVDLKSGTLRVRHNLTAHDELKGPKTRAGVRDVGLPPHLATMLAQWISDFYIANAEGLVFRTRANTAYRSADFHTGYWHPVLKRAGIYREPDRLHFHALRHFAASWMIKKGMPLPDVARALGHQTFDTTLQVYAHSITSTEAHLAALRTVAGDLVAGNQTALLPPQ